ncbi:hypothetical protein LWC34_11650 [Kibdelosporangium philippinense]|uniref:Uncharacterized protein n=1 Tax=Kibdelosporangium philippinense TaxID=211113 RepID=A0ABS8Z8X5_9PSEU|nr:hypothetical protein [Kibdelosporangium philippinense]MCE7003478.1 hypothetical protein [Kibdelosporangium philippinense]
MGASEWYNFAPYQPDVSRAFTETQQRVLTERDYLEDVHDVGDFETLAELAELKEDEEFWEVGTHSILDMHAIGESVEVGVITAMSPQEVREEFGTDTPDHADFMRYRKTDSYHVERWHGRYAVLYEDGQPHEVVFWGASGD